MQEVRDDLVLGTKGVCDSSIRTRVVGGWLSDAWGCRVTKTVPSHTGAELENSYSSPSSAFCDLRERILPSGCLSYSTFYQGLVLQDQEGSNDSVRIINSAVSAAIVESTEQADFLPLSAF